MTMLKTKSVLGMPFTLVEQQKGDPEKSKGDKKVVVLSAELSRRERCHNMQTLSTPDDE